MTLISFAAVLVAVTLVVVAAVLVPVLLELRRTATAVREFVERAEAEILPSIRELHDTVADLKVISGGVAEKIEDIQCFMEVVGETGRGLKTISTAVSSAAGAFNRSSLWMTGAKVAGNYFIERVTKKRG
jgi:uncharacterized protein YoxC